MATVPVVSKQIDEAVENVIENSMIAMQALGYKAARNDLLQAERLEVCPMGAVIAYTNNMYTFPKSFMIGYMDGWDGKPHEPNEFVDNVPQYSYGHRKGVEHWYG